MGQGEWATILVGLIVAAGVVAILFLSSHNWGRALGTDYEGTIVDRWADYSNSDQGAQPYFRLLIEDQSGKRMNVRVDSDTYELAKVGMRIKSRAGKVVLIETQEKDSRSRDQ